MGELPDSVDWREAGVVTSVRDQGFCGSCWAFAASSTMASYAKINDQEDRPLLELSPQHLVSCSPNPLHCGGRGGCSGGIAQLAFTYGSLFGIVSEADYPYDRDDWKCLFDATVTDAAVTTMGFETLPHNLYLPLMDHLANVGPISTSVAASDWGLYAGGIYDGCSYDEPIIVNHAVMLVGYGSDPEGDYWLIRNSWGTNWGEEDGPDAGYMKLKRNENVLCGVDTSPEEGSY